MEKRHSIPRIIKQRFKQTSLFSTLACCVLAFMLTACQIKEGPGGSASITGRLFANDYNSDFTLLNGSYYVPDEDVFLIYGDEVIYGDDMKTHFDGRFRFDFLRKGSYTIFAYSKDSTGNEPAGIHPVMIEVEISSKSQEVDVGELVILK